MPGEIIAVTVFAGVVGLVLYGLSHDLRLWWEDRGLGADERRCRKVLALTEERFRSGAAFAEAMAAQLEELRGLPEIEPWSRWTP